MKRHLKHGEFLGRVNQKVDTLTFSYSDLSDFTDRTIPKHTHQDAHFCYIVRGTYVTNAHNYTEPCAAQTLIYHPPGTTHQDHYLSQGGRFLTVSIPTEPYDALKDELALLSQSTGFTDAESGWFGARLYAGLTQPDSLSRLTLESLVYEACAHIGRPKTTLETDAPRWLMQAKDLMCDVAHAPLTIRAIAEGVGVHPVHLARGFRRFLDCTPSAYVRRQRIIRACKYLTTTDTPIAHIALDCGFADQSELTKNFKRLTRLTPAAYRRLFAA